MTATAVIVVEGVLKSNNGDAVIAAGQRLYHGLAEVQKIALITDQDEAAVRRWLSINGFKAHMHLLAPEPDDVLSRGRRRVQQIIHLKEIGCDVEFLIEPNPKIAAKVFHQGTPVLLLAHPQYSKPEFRPGAKSAAIPWNQLTAEIRAQEELRAKDKRLEP